MSTFCGLSRDFEMTKESLAGVDFKKEENIRSLMMEAMRFHPVVTTVPYWVKSDGTSTGQGTWEHEAVCIDRALADPAVFPNPNTFLLNRPGQCSTDDSTTENNTVFVLHADLFCFHRDCRKV